MAQSIKLVIKNLRASFPHLFTPDEMSGKYQCDFLIRKDDPQVAEIKKAIAAVVEDAKENNKGKNVDFSKVLRDGDLERASEDAYAGVLFFTAKTTQPTIKQNVFKRTDLGVVKVDDETEFYGGCNCQASILVRWYEFNGKVGVHILLNGVCREEGGEPFGGNHSAESDFGSDDDDIE